MGGASPPEVRPCGLPSPGVLHYVLWPAVLAGRRAKRLRREGFHDAFVAGFLEGDPAGPPSGGPAPGTAA